MMGHPVAPPVKKKICGTQMKAKRHQRKRHTDQKRKVHRVRKAMD
jgi:hypothetical protein